MSALFTLLQFLQRQSQRIANNLAQTILIFWLFGIFVACVFGRKIQNRIDYLVDFIPYVGLPFLVFVTILFAVWYSRHAKRNNLYDNHSSPKIILLLCFVTVINGALFVLIARFLIELPIEAIHMIKYAALSFILFFCVKSKNYFFRFFFAFFIGAGIGCTEETLQIWVPDRFFDYRDLILNVVSCILGAWHALASRLAVGARNYTV